ncbi:hypothetical protein PVE_R2G0312 [Pseudomonas veronii 1YdBTEX2]|uniref:Uncharacterized protein n=1 Tax=Pseudomonas veronii 1YdBTEX2 TaxID=1295141 RepID=A0A1D3K808_PSEVE|nr:hypothetical protein [Pseudomonas veronii]SBW84341.1 hypothetical protein PVE_R2G0312 [Pseudomonas veronii 1YdBTEX2]
MTIAVEVPSTGSSPEAVLAKQRDLHSAGIRGMWLLPFPAFTPAADLPAAHLTWSEASGFTALLAGAGTPAGTRSINRLSDWAQVLPLQDFITSALNGALWFGTLREGKSAIVRVDGGFTKCNSCLAWTNLCSAIEIISPYSESFALYGLEQIPAHLLGELFPKDLRSFKVGDIRKRYHQPSKTSVVLNSCSACSAVQDRVAINDLECRQQPITQFHIQVSKQLAMATAVLPTARWRVSKEP